MEELLKLAKKGRFDEAESAWMAALEQDVVPWQGLLEVAEVLAQRKQMDLAESLMLYLVLQLRDRGDAGAALAVASHGCALVPESEAMRDEVTELYARVHAGEGGCDTLVKMTLGDRTMPLPDAIRRLQSLQRLSPGTYVRADPGARLGRVERLDEDRAGLVVVFPSGKEEYDAAGAERLRVVEPDDFRGLAFFEPERLSALAKDDPQGLIVLALKTFGTRADVDRLKLHIEPLLDDTTWAKWWSSLKRLVRNSPRIGLTEGKPESAFLRSHPVGREEQVRAAFDAATNSTRLRMALALLRERSQETDARRALLGHFARALAALLDPSSGASRGEALGALAVLETIERRAAGAEAPERPLPERWTDAPGLAELICSEFEEGPVLLAVLEGTVRWLPQRWREVCASAMPMLPKNACEAAGKRLADHGAWETLAGVVEDMLARPECSAGALVWLWKASCSDTYARAFEGLDQAVVLRRVLAGAASLGHAASGTKEERRNAMSQLRQALLADRDVLRELISKADEGVVRSILGLTERNTGFTHQAREELARIIRSHRPSLFRKEVPVWQEDVIYVTVAGRRKREEELDHIVNVRLPHVIKELGAAARLGDLSENAEYTAAVEERGRLARLSGAIQQELLRSRPITYEIAAMPYVTVGSRVQARDLATGEVETFRFLGPWDADPAAGVYSYKAALGLSFMGRKVGEKVTFDGLDGQRLWQVLEVAPAV